MTDLNLTPTNGDFLMPGDLLYDGPHRGVVVRWYPSEKGGSGYEGKTHYTHYDIISDGHIYRIALVSEEQYQVARGYVDIIDVLGTVPVVRVP